MRLSPLEKALFRTLQASQYAASAAKGNHGESRSTSTVCDSLKQSVATYPDKAVRNLEAWLAKGGERGAHWSMMLAAMREAPRELEVHTGGKIQGNLLEQCRFETVDDPQTGNRVGRFIQPAGVSMREIGEELNKAAHKMDQRELNAISPWMMENCLSNASAEEGVTHQVTLRALSNNKSRNEQVDYLKGEKELFAQADETAIIAGFYRLQKGFPKTQNDMGTEKDKGDWFKGGVARTARDQKAGVGALSSFAGGVCDFSSYDDYADGRVFAAGSPNHKS